MLRWGEMLAEPPPAARRKAEVRLQLAHVIEPRYQEQQSLTSGWLQLTRWDRVALSHSRSCPSMLAVALRGWRGEKAAASTDSVCPMPRESLTGPFHGFGISGKPAHSTRTCQLAQHTPSLDVGQVSRAVLSSRDDHMRVAMYTQGGEPCRAAPASLSSTSSPEQLASRRIRAPVL